jgi:hypothetical protein
MRAFLRGDGAGREGEAVVRFTMLDDDGLKPGRWAG